MKLIRHGVCLALIGTGLALSPLTQTTAGATAAPDDLLAQMRGSADGDTAVTTEKSTGKLGFIRATAPDGDLLPDVDGDSATAAADKARSYLDQYAGAFGAQPSQLEQVAASGSEESGWTISYGQQYRGLTVFGALLKANVDVDGDLTAVNGFVAPDLRLSTDARIDAGTAQQRATAVVKEDPPGGKKTDVSDVKAATAELMVYREGSVRGVRGDNLLVWYVEVGNGAGVKDAVFIDARTGKPVNRYSLVHEDLERHVYEKSYSPATQVWKEGDPFPGALSVWQQDEVESAGESYWMFQNTFGRDSYDGEGHKMETVNNDPRISCPNANWNGVTTNYCDGTAVDDVVAHEWGHAYTEYTGNLIYQWQPGALNESYSDVWGETLDLINDRHDDDEGDLDAKRPDGACTTHSGKVAVLDINTPAGIERTCEAGSSIFGAQLTPDGVTGDVVLARTASGATDGCAAITTDVTGSIALVDRSSGCGLVTKAKNAQAAGAIGVIMADNLNGYPTNNSGVDASITIPAIKIRLAHGDLIKSALSNGDTVNVTMKEKVVDRTDSYRWLMGEDASAFGAAIRDMWNPTCYGMPSKVSDAEYYCATDDAGGVHRNSGVPNHAYALLVDGGTSNGVTVNGIGLDKAANIWWRAQAAYQTPTTDFTQHADNLAAACSDLTGTDVTKLSFTEGAAPGTVKISGSDCAQVQSVINATELRKEPTQCNFKPLLDPDAPDLCGTGFATNNVFVEDFEDGLTGWETDQVVVNDGAKGFPWEADTTAPGGRSGTVAYGPTPDGGSCSDDADDLSSADAIISPVVQLPTGKLRSTKLSFKQYIATELGYDGGTVSVSVNDGEFETVPASAYVFNAARALATAGNTNPLAGQDGFTGTDEGKLGGSWGTSIVDLAAVGAAGGDTLRLKFDIGRDGCGGIDGWYVDDVKVTACKTKTKVTATHKPDPSKIDKPSKVVAKVGRDGTSGERPDGRVVVKKGAKVLAQGRLVDGRVTLTLKARSLKVGKHTVQVVYLGNGTYGRSQTGLVVKIKK